LAVVVDCCLARHLPVKPEGRFPSDQPRAAGRLPVSSVYMGWSPKEESSACVPTQRHLPARRRRNCGLVSTLSEASLLLSAAL
jgi:hypothetical protein